jgi:thymidylate synthase (FAD)
MSVDWKGEGTHGERLIEFAGRICYMSQNNPADRTTAEYIGNIMRQHHGSVLEHANYSLLLEGISRTCSHELVRHRAGCAYSQLSQRYVGAERVSWVMPPLLIGSALENDMTDLFRNSTRAYEYLGDVLREKPGFVPPSLTGLERKKTVNQTARASLGNAAETKIVMTGNLRAWRTILEQRGAPAAETEIRRLAVRIYNVLMGVAPAAFQDVTTGYIVEAGLQYMTLQFQHSKV